MLGVEFPIIFVLTRYSVFSLFFTYKPATAHTYGFLVISKENTMHEYDIL